MSSLEWIDSTELRAIHLELLAEHGGSPGTRDEGLMEAPLERSDSLTGNGVTAVAGLAAAYAAGIARNHPFISGSTPTAFAAAAVFLLNNGWELVAAQAEALSMMLGLAAGETSEAEFELWIAKSIQPIRATTRLSGRWTRESSHRG